MAGAAFESLPRDGAGRRFDRRVFFDDFRSFPPGPVPADYTPTREYHFFMPGRSKVWQEGTLVGAWRPKERWHAVEIDGESALEQVTHTGPVPAMFVAQPWELGDGLVRAGLRPLSSKGRCGLVFDYRDALHFRALLFRDGALQLVDVENDIWETLDEAPAAADADRRYVLSVRLEGGQVRAEAAADGDGERWILTGRRPQGAAGRVGLLADAPARFYSVEILADEGEVKRARRRRSADEAAAEEARRRLPKPKLDRVIETPGFGTGKALRFGDLDGDGRLEIVIAQHERKVVKDSYAMITCLTAVDLDGRVIWQNGRPSGSHPLPTNDLPVQVHDIDGDGCAEVICARDFRLQILDGRTGRVKRETPTPRARHEDAFDRIPGDCIHLCDVRGLGRPQDILIKDRYHSVWLFDDQLNYLWSADGRTGHFPLSYDFNGDGRDELVIGYSMHSADGELLWDLGLGDHADALGILRHNDGRPFIVIAAGDEGFLFADIGGRIFHHERTGHVQTVNAGNFRPERPGLELVTITYWRQPGILSIYDETGRLLHRSQPCPVGSHIQPVNWSGDGSELILFSASASHPGLLEGRGRSVLHLPDDGHPELCCAALDLLGDPRDEIVAWDKERIFIYTQDEPFAGDRVYAPSRPALYNASNYRCEISLPGWRAAG